MGIYVGMDDLNSHAKEYLEYIEAELIKRRKKKN